MIFLMAGNYNEAKKWAKAQGLDDKEWFYTLDVDDLNGYMNFHTIVTDSAGELNPHLFEKIYSYAKLRGKMGR